MRETMYKAICRNCGFESIPCYSRKVAQAFALTHAYHSEHRVDLFRLYPIAEILPGNDTPTETESDFKTRQYRDE